MLRAAGGSFNEELGELQLLSGVLLWLLCGRWSTAPPSDALGELIKINKSFQL